MIANTVESGQKMSYNKNDQKYMSITTAMAFAYLGLTRFFIWNVNKALAHAIQAGTHFIKAFICTVLIIPTMYSYMII